jgi:hypothetical protein
MARYGRSRRTVRVFAAMMPPKRCVSHHQMLTVRHGHSPHRAPIAHMAKQSERYCLSHKLVPEPCAVGLDQPRRRMWKMDRQNIFAGPGDLGEELSSRPRGLRRIPVEDRRPIGLATLRGVVHEVADHDRLLSARADIDAAMAGRMAGRRHEPKRIVELIAVIFDDRLAIVVKHIAAASGTGFAALSRFLPGGIFALVENIFGFRKCRHPAAIALHRVPAAMVDVQMRAEHIIDVFETQARGRKTIEPCFGKSIGGG